LNFQHAVALGLVGWYLMVPPFDSNRQPNYTAQLIRWRRISSFESLKDCEKRESILDEIAEKNAARQGYFLSTACIASDDPGLNNKVKHRRYKVRHSTRN
jgi:hypothetical protein